MESQGDDPVGGSRSYSFKERAAHPSVNRVRWEDAVAVEEVPTMRAVALVGNAPLLAHDSLGTRQFGAMPPPSFGMLRPVTGLKGGLSVKKEWSGEVKVPASWILKSDKLEPVPLDFPLERTHREIYHVDPCEVASRISDALRILSIEAEYDCDRAKAKCRTSDFVSFRIRLYAGGEHNQPVVVEVQRRSGSGMSFMQSCRAILDAAEGVRILQMSKKRGPPGFVASPIGGMKCLQGLPPPEFTSAASLEAVLPLLASEKRDANILGMEKLSFLTDPIKTHPACALRVCKVVALGDASCSVREDTLALLARDTFEFDPDESEHGSSYMEQMRHLALVVFSNAFAMTGKDGSLAQAILEQPWFGESLLPVLLDELKDARTRPHCAHEAACSISSFAEASEVARKVLVDHNCVGILEDAFAVGKESHELLANETKRCLAGLDCST